MNEPTTVNGITYIVPYDLMHFHFSFEEISKHSLPIIH
jgi:hypothetical protein